MTPDGRTVRRGQYVWVLAPGLNMRGHRKTQQGRVVKVDSGIVTITLQNGGTYSGKVSESYRAPPHLSPEPDGCNPDQSRDVGRAIFQQEPIDDAGDDPGVIVTATIEVGEVHCDDEANDGCNSKRERDAGLVVGLLVVFVVGVCVGAAMASAVFLVSAGG